MGVSVVIEKSNENAIFGSEEELNKEGIDESMESWNHENMKKEDSNTLEDTNNILDNKEHEEDAGNVEGIENVEDDNKGIDLDDLAMQELDQLKEEKKEEEKGGIPFRNEIENEDDEFGDIGSFDIADSDNQDFQNFNFNFTTTTQKEEIKPPNSLKESKLEFLLRYLFYFYFLLLSYLYKLDEKTEFVERFIEKSKKTVDDLILRIERTFAKLSPGLYRRIVRDSEILGTLIILAVLHYNFHAEATKAKQNNNKKMLLGFPSDLETKIDLKEEKEIKEQEQRITNTNVNASETKHNNKLSAF
ncbi:hypothetical protein ACO3VM_09435 (plasmid) [Methanocaldococcus sp. 10A]